MSSDVLATSLDSVDCLVYHFESMNPFFANNYIPPVFFDLLVLFNY